MNQARLKKLTLSLSLVAIGIVIGTIWVSGLHLFPYGRAANNKLKPPAIMETEQAFVAISKAVTPAVVNISAMRSTKKRNQELGFPFDDPFFRQFFGKGPFEQRESPRKEAPSLGSGVILSADGLIVTNNHVIAKADQIKVILSDEREFIGKVVGADPKSDIAVIQIPAKNLPFLQWGDSSMLQVGEYILAIGNPFGFSQTVTMGIVSAIGRANIGIADYEDFIQTDAAINPGNSGGAMVNTHGELVGINTAIYTQSGGYMGIGFAVPSNMAKSVVDSLVKNGKVVRGWLGLSIQEVTPQLAKKFGLKDTGGALIADILPDSPAQRSGLERGDIVLSFNGEPVENSTHLRNKAARSEAGEEVVLEILRDGKQKQIRIKISEQPSDMDLQRPIEPGETDSDDSEAIAGIRVHDLSPEIAQRYRLESEEDGVVVMDIDPEGTGYDAGIREGDLIVEVNRQSVSNVKEYHHILSRAQNGSPILFFVRRQGRGLFLTVTPD